MEKKILISGEVIDQINNEAVDYANVIILDATTLTPLTKSNGNSKIGAVVGTLDLASQYSIYTTTTQLPPGFYAAQFSFVGYKTRIVYFKIDDTIFKPPLNQTFDKPGNKSDPYQYPYGKNIDLGTTILSDLELDTVIIDAKKEESGIKFYGSIFDKVTGQYIAGATINSPIAFPSGSDNPFFSTATSKAPSIPSSDNTYTDNTSENYDPNIGTTQYQGGEFNLAIIFNESDKIYIDTKTINTGSIDHFHTVVVGGIRVQGSSIHPKYAFKEFMRDQWEKAELETNGVEFINYNEYHEFDMLIQRNPIRNIIAFSGGGLIIWPYLDGDFDFIGLIDPSTFPQGASQLVNGSEINYPIRLDERNTKMISNSSNWSYYEKNDGGKNKYLYDNLVAMENAGFSDRVKIKHDQMPITFFKTYGKLFNNPTNYIYDTTMKYKPFNITVTAEGYEPAEVPAVSGDGQLIQDLGKIRLIPVDVKKEIVKQKQVTVKQKQIIKKKEQFIPKLLKKLLKTLQNRLIPAILNQIALFGISKINEELITNVDLYPKMCPPNIGALNKVIKKKNQLTKQINNLYKSINSINSFLKIPEATIPVAETAITAAKIAYSVQANIPSTVATPNPVGPILTIKDIIEKFEDLKDVLQEQQVRGSIQLRIIIEELKKILTLLNVLDALIQSCAEEMGNSNITQTQVSNDLLLSTQQQSNQLSPVVTNVNGFKMSVINVDNVTINGLRRRRAIAQNKAGVIMLQGEPSFSSNDQILIDELVFYIQQNDLKAD